MAEAILDIRLAQIALDVAGELAGFMGQHPAAGAIVSFTGQVRGGEGVEALELTQYAPLTLPGMAALGADAAARWPLAGLLIVHRIGELAPGAPIVLVAAAARHRRAAFDAADFVMDHLKSAAWLWKREKANGVWRWVDPRADDHADLARWVR